MKARCVPAAAALAFVVAACAAPPALDSPLPGDRRAAASELGRGTSSSPIQEWRQVATFGGPAVSFSTAFTIGDRAYVGTGYGPTTEFWQYDPATDAWTRRADFPGSARGAAVGFSLGERGYLGTGYAGSGQVLDWWEYDPSADRWTQKTPIPGAPRDHAGAFVIGQKGYVVNGTVGEGPGSVLLREVWEYDPQLDSWTRKADMPEGVGAPACFVLNDRGYVVTGLLGQPPTLVPSRSLWEYDPTADAWTRRADFPGAGRYRAVALSMEGRGFVGTGIESIGATSAVVFADLWEYDPSADAWTRQLDFAGPARGAAVAFSVGPWMYLGTGTGAGRNALGDFWRAGPGVSAADGPGDARR